MNRQVIHQQIGLLLPVFGLYLTGQANDVISERLLVVAVDYLEIACPVQSSTYTSN
jgi:hypothetical protein